MRCPICEGTGRMQVEEGIPRRQDDIISCIACNGTGEVPFFLWIKLLLFTMKRK